MDTIGRQSSRCLLAFLVFGVVAVGGLFAARNHHSEWTATVTGVIVPRPGPAGVDNAYQLDVLSRGLVTKTYATAMRDRRFEEEAEARLGPVSGDKRPSIAVHALPRRAVITISVTSERRHIADVMVRNLFESAQRYFEGLGQLYTVQRAAPPGSSKRVTEVTALTGAVILSVAIGCAWTTTLLVRRLSRRHPT